MSISKKMPTTVLIGLTVVAGASSLLLFGSAISDTSPTTENYGESITWVLEDAAEPALSISGEPGTALTVEFLAVLDWREHRWEVGPYEIGSDGTVEFDVVVPDDAFLHSAAADYLTELICFVDFEGHRNTAPPTYIAWPNGAEQSAEIWGLVTQKTLAPDGVVNSELRGASTASDEWVMPDVGQDPAATSRTAASSSSRTSDTGVTE